MAGVGRVGPNIPDELRLAIGTSNGTVREVAKTYGVSRASVYSARLWVRSLKNAERTSIVNTVANTSHDGTF